MVLIVALAAAVVTLAVLYSRTGKSEFSQPTAEQIRATTLFDLVSEVNEKLKQQAQELQELERHKSMERTGKADERKKEIEEEMEKICRLKPFIDTFTLRTEAMDSWKVPLL